MDYQWPRNIRELENTIEYGIVVEKAALTSPSLPDKLQKEPKSDSSSNGRLRLAEKEVIVVAVTNQRC